VRDEYLTPGERLREAEIAEAARDRQQYRDAVRGFAHDYARMTGDPKAAALIHDYVQYRSPPLDRESIDEMREALRVASGAGGDYLALPEAACNRCLELCFALEKQGDRRLIDILDAAERRGVAGGPETIYDRYPGLTRDEGVDRARGKDLEVDLDFDEERGPRRRR
jgi:hypothetical protein